ncbi:hypothetical protein FHS00_002069 [Limimaricola variabilis]|uniref:Phosphoadenosine phosphosulfate reductase n=1 Tax=Limimaricola variabilis TaxID=1492771 RepID=A0ABR6HPX1_9RHOB|nr:hypothetical protein [Limimaricola variabilis]MBB3712481.1 hypothetical protein [Limimaricola variabilis]
MTENLPDPHTDLSGLSPADWQAQLDRIGEEFGYYEPLGQHHAALFIDAGPRLLVTFETRDSIRRRPRALPRGFEMLARTGWSLLVLIADDEGWFRSPRVWGYVDRLVDEGFFEDFERVLFHGHHACGYAAAAYSVASPGARVLALRPMATLDPAIAGWDRRHLAARRLDFTSRFGYAPDMVDAAAKVTLIHDPRHAADSIHAALYRRPNVVALPAFNAGSRIEPVLDQIGAMPELLELAMEDRLDRAAFAKIWRGRRGNPLYLRGLLRQLEQADRPAQVARLCRHGITTPEAKHYARRLEALIGADPAETRVLTRSA